MVKFQLIVGQGGLHVEDHLESAICSQQERKFSGGVLGNRPVVSLLGMRVIQKNGEAND